MTRILETKWEVRPAVTADSYIDADGVLSVALHNAGDADVTLNGGWTLSPGSNFQIGLPAADVVLFDRILATFGAGSNPRLEVSFLRVVGERFGNYPENC